LIGKILIKKESSVSLGGNFNKKAVKEKLHLIEKNIFKKLWRIVGNFITLPRRIKNNTKSQ
jgi:hypothetical protein